MLKLAPAVIGLTAALLLASPDAVAATPRWVTAWSAAADQAGPPVADETVRQVVRASIGGSQVRVRLSNRYGATPLTLGPVHLARPEGPKDVRPGSGRAVLFGGQPTVTIPAGGEALSDAADFPVRALETVSVSLYAAAGSGRSTLHGFGGQTAFIARGDTVAALRFPKGRNDSSRIFITGLEVAARKDARTLVVIGDSITDGVGSADGVNYRWPDALAERLEGRAVAVANAGIAGNRLLRDAARPFVGDSIATRFGRDALDQPKVGWVIVLAGINDIDAKAVLSDSAQHATAAEVIAGLEALASRAHARGAKIYGGTLLPHAGGRFTWDGAEPMRQVVNAWVRSAGAFDAVIDFDAALRDPAQPDRLNPLFDSGDHLHPNDAGHAAIAAAVDLALFEDEVDAR